ncbi:SDR family NAD(P)-dependent oxidoreductase [Mycolicibacterium confluentis]|uniref:Short-chain dehydrogenase n=1 Tax=Mycolicibacterium confluentis TaxID=28047 RepID=A0A7I7XUM3_9MYCO|nr:SDR family NAD(P)-dependent oxidoreductase [Mycolicibacterium confluentis]MCV7322168.1 SDR family NAD(P)-dependent oxidoreductase [Mycolicibacterium confluentis]ORV31513.1 short-chain dehydrogenase [Mycolicibacterium confluentis]BBZ32937.1 short-chain dehydrogenase [Mycolicibacterium confluentis]
MNIDGATALVTGANRGIGRHFAGELLRRGAKVYATARRPESVDIPGAEVIRLDITDQASVDAAAAYATDVDVLINNAADTAGGNLVTGDLAAIRSTMDSNYYGTLAMIRAFAPILARNGGGAILNVLSAAAWNTVDGNTAYAAAKSAQWGLTNGVRRELEGQGTLVSALVPALVGTQTLLDFAQRHGIVFPEGAVGDPGDLVRRALDGLEADEIEILDPLAAEAKATLAGPPQAFAL